MIFVPFIGLFWNGFILIVWKAGNTRQSTFESHDNENNSLNNQNNFKKPLSDEADDTCICFLVNDFRMPVLPMAVKSGADLFLPQAGI